MSVRGVKYQGDVRVALEADPSIFNESKPVTLKYASEGTCALSLPSPEQAVPLQLLRQAGVLLRPPPRLRLPHHLHAVTPGRLLLHFC